MRQKTVEDRLAALALHDAAVPPLPYDPTTPVWQAWAQRRASLLKRLQQTQHRELVARWSRREAPPAPEDEERA